jgi:uncharacterized protein (UPF0332 family)
VTNDNRRKNLANEVARADEALRAAEALLGLGLHADAVSRAYYAVLHLVRALLLSRGVEAKTHAGVIHLFNMELVRTGAFPSANNRVLGGLQRARELADYDAAVTFSEDDARAEITDARVFSVAALEFLKREGWLDPQAP